MSAVDELRRHLGLDRPALVGHSYGGMLAVALAAGRPGAYRVVVNIDGIGFALGSEAEPEVQNEQLPVVRRHRRRRHVARGRDRTGGRGSS